MTVNLGGGYLSGLADDQSAELTRVNAPGLTALREYLSSGQAVAFLGAGASRPLYPLWDGLIGELVDAATDRLTPKEQATCQALAHDSPEAIVEIVRRGLGPGVFRETLRGVLRVRTDPESGRSWTPVQELVCRCPFKAVVTTNYDPGIVDARMRVRPAASATGFMTWEDELGLDRWRSGDVFAEAELPVLFAHGQHNQPDSIVLATTEYRRAYAGKLPHVLARLMDGHLIWLGFSFADQRIAAILREIANHTGTRIDPGGAPRHIAMMAWDPDAADNDTGVLAQRAEIEYGAQVVLYPAPSGDHSALVLLLETLTDARFPAAGDLPARAGSLAAGPIPAAGPGGLAAPGARDLPGLSAGPGGGDGPGGPVPRGRGIPVSLVPAAEPVAHFTGRAEELARLDRWAADPQVSLIGVTAWGGAGKTVLVTRWVEAGGASRRPGIQGVFGWSFYADPSADHWAEALLKWAAHDLGIVVAGSGRLAVAVLAVLRTVPMLLVLDGLEVVQEGPAGGEFGRLLDGTLREVLAGACHLSHTGLVLLTSRFPFADLETFDGSSARMLEVPPFTPAEGADLLAAAGGAWLPEGGRKDLVAAVDGHALAVSVLAGLLADRPPAADLAALRTELDSAARTDTRVSKVLGFYASRLGDPDRYLLAAVSLFTRPVEAGAVLAVAAHEAFGNRLAGWTPGMVRDAVRERLAGLATWHPDDTISAHPLVRDTFRPLALPAAATAADTTLTGLPQGKVTTRADALQVTEAIELLLDAELWQPADNLYTSRCGSAPSVWKTLPAARLGQRTATAFVATPAHQAACATHLTPDRLGFYLNDTGLFAMHAGDLATARDYLTLAARHSRDAADMSNLAVDLRNLAGCLGRLGLPGPAREAATESLTSATAADDRDSVRRSHAYLGWLAGLAGDSTAAEYHLTTADQISLTDDGEQLYSLLGVWWAQWLVRTERGGPAQELTRRNVEISRENGWTEDLARCDQILGGLALAAGDTATADTHLNAAAATFRDGDYLTELAEALPGLAACARATGDPDTAERYAAEAISIAAPRELMPALCAALTARALIRASQSTAEGTNPDHLAKGWDAADAALRLATRHQLAWHELDALRAHAELDQAEGADRGWAAKADALHNRLVPPGLDPDPLGTMERLVAEQKAAKEANDENEGDD